MITKTTLIPGNIGKTGGWHNLPIDNSFRTEVPKKNPQTIVSPSYDEDADPVDLNQTACLVSTSPVRKILKGVRIYASKFKANPDARSCSSQSIEKLTDDQTESQSSMFDFFNCF